MRHKRVVASIWGFRESIQKAESGRYIGLWTVFALGQVGEAASFIQFKTKNVRPLHSVWQLAFALSSFFWS